MDQQETTIRNADLWSRYFADQWGRWLDPLGTSAPVAEIAEGSGARMANLLTAFASGPIAWLYRANASALAQDARESRLTVVERTEDRRELVEAVG